MKIAEVRVQAAGLVPDLLEELDRAVTRADIGVLVHLQADLLTVAGRVLGQFTDQRCGAAARLR